jgi:E3 ubiquitin-protein ligase HUWE1
MIGHQPFSRLRNTPAACEATTHPFLLVMTPSTNRNNTIQGRGIHHAHRILGAGTGPPDILQMIDQMLGEGSI